MKAKLFLVLVLFFSQNGISVELKQFLKSCGYGTLAGAGLGFASLVFEKKPNDSYGNIARGASLGLYAGIGYGLFSMQQETKPTNDIVLEKNKTQYFVFPTVAGEIKTLFVFQF